MNAEAFKILDGQSAIGVRVRLPDSPLIRQFFTPPGYGTVLILNHFLNEALKAAGVKAAAELFGDPLNFGGMVAVYDPEKGLNVIRSVLTRSLFHPAELFIYDPAEVYWRPVGQHADLSPFDHLHYEEERQKVLAIFEKIRGGLQ